MGIYGFLSAAYQETYSKLSMVENQKEFINKKINFYQNDVTRYDTEIDRISSNISTLSNAKVSNIQVRDTSVSTGFRSTISTTELRMAQKRIEVEEENRKLVQSKRIVASDSLQKFQLQVLKLDNSNEVAGELGPLQYLSGLTGYPMDQIINWLLLIIIFVFDPLAISLVVAANFAFDRAYPKIKYRDNLYGEKVKEKEKGPTTTVEIDKEFDFPITDYTCFPDDYDEDRMNIIGQNGNEGTHYESAESKLKLLEEELDSLPKTKLGVYVGQESRRTNLLDKIKRIKNNKK
jgi:hypothetical protein